METTTILLLAAILFCLIAVLGGGFVVREIQIPLVPPWARVVSGLLGLILFVMFIFLQKIILPPPLSGVSPPVPSPVSPPASQAEHTIHSLADSDISEHGFKLISLVAKCRHQPPRLHDSIQVEFTLQNTTKNPIRVLATFVVGRDPDGNNRDFGTSNKNKEVQPNEVIKTTGNSIVNVPGVWIFGPSYQLDKDIYPEEWHRFQVFVAP